MHVENDVFVHPARSFSLSLSLLLLSHSKDSDRIIIWMCLDD